MIHSGSHGQRGASQERHRLGGFGESGLELVGMREMKTQEGPSSKTKMADCLERARKRETEFLPTRGVHGSFTGVSGRRNMAGEAGSILKGFLAGGST